MAHDYFGVETLRVVPALKSYADANLKHLILKSRAHRFFLEARAIKRNFTMSARRHARSNTTAYCISPYKTGTTYAWSLFSQNCCAAHEPLHYETLKKLEDIGYLRRRGDFLDLEFESSGFFAGRINTLRMIAPGAPLLLLYRDFEEWIVSFINHFTNLSESVNFNYPVRILFDELCGARVDEFFNLSTLEQEKIISTLWRYWVNCYEDAVGRERVMVVDLRDFDKLLPKVAAFLELVEPRPATTSFKRTNERKRAIDISAYIDLGEVRSVSSRLVQRLKLTKCR